MKTPTGRCTGRPLVFGIWDVLGEEAASARIMEALCAGIGMSPGSECPKIAVYGNEPRVGVPQDSPRWPQDGPKMAPRQPKMVPRLLASE